MLPLAVALSIYERHEPCKNVAANGVEQIEKMQTALQAILVAMEATVQANEETVEVGHQQQARAEEAQKNAETVQVLADEAQQNTERVYRATMTLKELAHLLKARARTFKI